MEFRLGVIGATGYIGTPYRDEVRESGEARIVGLCARRQDRLADAARLDRAELATADWRTIVEHPDINLVLVCTPDALHHEAVLACRQHNKHLFCEKPIGVNAVEARQMWEAYRDANLAHYVPFWTRYVEPFIRARQLVQQGALGDLRAIIYRWHNPRPIAMPFTWRDDASLSSAGSIADVGSHAYDAVRWITGSEATRVLAHADTITPPKPDLGNIDLTEALEWGESHSDSAASQTRQASAFDYASIAWEFSNGAVGAIILSHAPFLRKGLCPELELHGTEASLAIDRVSYSLTVQDASGKSSTETFANTGFGNRFSKYVFPALRQRANNEPCEHPGLEDGWRVQLFTDAAAQSARRGTWVSLSELE